MGRAKSGLKWGDAAALVGAEALRAASRTNQRSNWTTGRQLVPWSIIGPLLLARFTVSAQASQESGVTLTAPEAPMNPDDRRAWEEFNQIINNRDKKRHHDWMAVKGLLLGYVKEREEARQRPREKPAPKIAKAAQ